MDWCVCSDIFNAGKEFILSRRSQKYLLHNFIALFLKEKERKIRNEGKEVTKKYIVLINSQCFLIYDAIHMHMYYTLYRTPVCYILGSDVEFQTCVSCCQ
jgi:hypothetical protein